MANVASFTVLYFRVAGAPERLAEVQREYRAGEPRNGFVMSAPRQGFDDGPDGMAELSQRFGEVLRISVHSNVCAFSYERWIAGERKRGLSYTPEMQGWYIVAGEPEPWERELIFDPARIAKERAHVTESGDSAALAAFDDVVRAGRLVEGARHPAIVDEQLAQALVARLDLPVYRLDRAK